MNYKKLYRLAKMNVRICSALERCGCDYRKLSPTMTAYSERAKALQASLTPEEQDEAVGMIGKLNGLRLECKRKFWKNTQDVGPDE